MPMHPNLRKSKENYLKYTKQNPTKIYSGSNQ